MKLLAEAIRKGGVNRKGIRDALAGTRDFKGITGTISFSESGDAEFRDTSIVCVSEGEFVPFNREDAK
jgi:branched-chain amino acid transport system substrate-binding protein